ncbi:hypothetical protein [Actinacidiphila sp. bgisy144]|uniref:hypothetical protein n=1 Tax=Actinacidiphila sp. bgisy144 TaxID=3413791 RepID=UPI003EB71196
MKHSITKRFTLAACWEVRLVPLRLRTALSASCRIVEPLVAQVLVRAAANECATVPSWPKIAVPALNGRRAVPDIPE